MLPMHTEHHSWVHVYCGLSTVIVAIVGMVPHRNRGTERQVVWSGSVCQGEAQQAEGSCLCWSPTMLFTSEVHEAQRTNDL